jgi:methyltransferase (TIGR00027 family)
MAIARVRAEERALPEAERLFEDPYAALFAGDYEEDAVGERMLSIPFLRESVRLRTRVIDDVVRDGLAAGLRQLVILGVGFDCRALRLAEIEATGALVFEVDFPAQLAAKQSILSAANVRLPRWVRTVPCDFTVVDFETILARDVAARGFRQGAGAVFVWEGVVGYLDDAAVDRTLALVTGLGGRGSRLVLNYSINRFVPAALVARLHGAGFSAVHDESLDPVYQRLLDRDAPPEANLFRIVAATV